MAEPAHDYVVEPFSYREAEALVRELGVSEPVAVTLVRRGHRTPEAARVFLDASEQHDPYAFDSMAEAVALLRGAIDARRRITVHGDFDVDGVCATTILVATLRDLGARCDWFIPDRLADGYGLSAETVELLAARGTELLVTADCGITAAAEVAAARAAGLEVIVTDHHEPGDDLPSCSILHPVISGYPFPKLCGTGVAYKLASALRATAGRDDDPDRDLDLVALATVADVVPLLGENRALVRRGLEVARRAGRPGLRALIAVSGGEPAQLDEGDFAFRLCPRVNAAGRLYRADAGVELFLTEDGERAKTIASELDRANRERQATEMRVEAEAERARRKLPEELREAPALVLGGEGWHPGVVGIVASRLAERYWRPVVLVSLDRAGGGRGSGRSIPGFDLLEGLRAAEAHLKRYGGHRAAAGLELDPGRLDSFRAAFIAHARQRLGPRELTRTEHVDALVTGRDLALELAEEMQRLAPFGAGNPGVRLLVPAARLRDQRSMGDGRHSRFSLQSGGSRALGVAFGASRLPVDEDEVVDASVKLEVNRWNGSVEPRIVLRDLYRLAEGDRDRASDHARGCRCETDEWWRRVEAQLASPLDSRAGPDLTPTPGARRRHNGRPGSVVAILAELVSSGAPVLALCADASRRAELALGAAGLARFSRAGARVVCGRCGAGAVASTLRDPREGLVLADWAALSLSSLRICGFDHVVLVDPPPFAAAERFAASGEGHLHLAWGEAERAFASRVLEDEWGLRRGLEAIFRAVSRAELGGEDGLRGALAGPEAHRRSPELAARCVRVLLELGIMRGDADGGVRALRVVSSEGTELERSQAYRAYRSRLEEGQQFLARQRRP